MRRTALSAVLFVGACTRLNPAYADSAGSASETDSAASTLSDGNTSDEPSTTRATTSQTESSAGATTGDPGDDTESTICLDVQGPCDAFGQDECAGDQRCRPWGSPGALQGVACVVQPSEDTPLERDDRCMHTCVGGLGVDNCPARTVCDPFTNEPACVGLCGRDDSGEPTCPDGRRCRVHSTDDGDFGLCRPQCDLLQPDCPSGLACYPTAGTGLCIPEGPIEPGDACSTDNDCGGGFVCTGTAIADCDGDASACCTALCDLADENDSVCDRWGGTCTASPVPVLVAANAGLCLL